jgi:hypothetical protein
MKAQWYGSLPALYLTYALKGCLYILDMGITIISVNCMAEAGCKVIFEGGT